VTSAKITIKQSNFKVNFLSKDLQCTESSFVLSAEFGCRALLIEVTNDEIVQKN